MDDFDIIQDITEQEESLFDIAKIKVAIWHKKWLILLLMIAGFIVSYLLVKNPVPKYSTYVTLKTQEFAQDGNRILSRNRQVEMRSRTFAERVVEKMGLALELEDNSGFKSRDELFSVFYTSTDPLPGCYKVTFDDDNNYYLYKTEDLNEILLDSAKVWDVVDTNRSTNGFTFRLHPEIIQIKQKVPFKVRPFMDAVNDLQSVLQIIFSDNGAFMTIKMEGTDPDLLPKELNKIAEVYVQETLRLKQKDVSGYTGYLKKRLKAAENNVQKANAALQHFYQRYPLSLDAGKRSLLDELQASDRALRELPAQQKQLTQLLNQLEQLENGPDYESSRRFIVRQIANFPAMGNEVILTVLRGKLLSQENQYDKLLNQYSASHSLVLELGDKIKETQNSIIAFAIDYLDTLIERERESRANRQKLQAQLKRLPNDEIQLMELERDKRISEEFYTFLYSEMQKLQISEMSREDDITILDRAIRPSSPSGGNKKTKILLGGFGGFFFGIFIAIALELLNKSIGTAKDVERFLHYPVIGVIPLIYFKDIPEHNDFEKIKQLSSQLVEYGHSSSPIGESYRALRTNLMFSKKTGKIQTLLITSITPEEGKSFTAGNLAIIFAKQQRRTLLIDADLRRGILHNSFNVKKEPGFANYLNNGTTLIGIIQQTYIPNLSVISCGSMISNPSEMLGSLTLRRFLEEVRRKYDFIIIDTPPLNAATDSVVLSTQVDAVAVVIRGKQINRDEAKERLEIFQSIPANFIGVILNGSDSRLGQKYYAYYHY